MKYCLLVLLLCFSSLSFAIEAPKIYVVTSGDNVFFNEIASELKKQLQKKHSTVYVERLVVQGQALSRIRANDLLVSVGEQTSLKVAKYHANNKKIFTFVSQRFVESLQSKMIIKNWTAVVIDQKLEKLLVAASSLIKSRYKKKIIILVNENNQSIIQRVQAVSKFHNMDVKIVMVGKDQEPAKLIKPYLFNAAAIVAYNDEEIWSSSNVKWLLYQSYVNKVPVVGYSESFLRAGALVSVYSSKQSIVQATTQVSVYWIKNKQLSNLKISYASPTVKLNSNVARVFNFNASVVKSIKASL